MNHAQELGIDLDKLETERFGTYEHYQAVKTHLDRVRAYEISKAYTEAQERMAEALAEDKRRAQEKRQAENQNRRKRRRGEGKRQQRYDFTDKQLEIALNSIQRHADHN